MKIPQNPDQHVLRDTQWQFFVTLTFKREELSFGRRIKLFFGFGRKVASWFRVYFPRLKWALRMEAGEKNGRLHFHVLIAGLPENSMQTVTCKAMEKLWEKTMRVGIADARLWEQGRDAVSYITKGQGDFSCVGANGYEHNKFGGRCAVILSKSLLGYGSWRRSRTTLSSRYEAPKG
jgi:hypothetical protein